MKIMGCDFHTRYQQIAMMDEATGELIERRLDHENGWPTLPGLFRSFQPMKSRDLLTTLQYVNSELLV